MNLAALYAADRHLCHSARRQVSSGGGSGGGGGSTLRTGGGWAPTTPPQRATPRVPPTPLDTICMQSQVGATSSSSSQNSMLTSLHFCSGPAALRALQAGTMRARLPASRMPLRCMASKGRKKDAEESEQWWRI